MTTGSQADIVARLKVVLPARWFPSPGVTTPTGSPILDALLGGVAAVLSFVYGLIQYARNQTRIRTASDGWLDLIAADYFGTGLPRLPGEYDASYLARILAALLPTGATRAAVTAAVTAVTGQVPRVIEPWQPADTGVLGGKPGAGMAFWDVDTPATPFRWTNPGLRYQGFIETVLPQPVVFGPNAPPCFDTNPGGSGFWGFYWTVAGSSFLNPPNAQLLGVAPVYGAINRTKAEGTVVWVKAVGALTPSGSPFVTPPSLTSDTGIPLTSDTGAPVSSL